jgi:extracellular elastinolytic metalloproteinase
MSRRSIVFTGCLVLFVLGLGSQDGYTAPPSGSKSGANPIGFLTGPNTGKPRAIALKYLRDNKESLGLNNSDIAGVVVTDEYISAHNGVTHLYLRQRYHGFEVHGANININIAADGSIINLGNQFVPDIASAINATTAGLNRGQAISAAARSLGLDESKGAISRKPIPSKLVYQPVAKNLVRLAWDLEIYEMDAKNWWSMRVDAVTGELLDQANYVVHDNFEVFEAPVESPSHGSRSVAGNPEDTTASIVGWVDAQCTDGNNVDAYIDDNNSNSPSNGDGSRACDSSLNFSFPVNFNQNPSQYQDAAVTNLFYWNNLIHDVFYQYGFDEAGGNFQENNFGNGGSGSDSVLAEAQDGGGTNNANFATPPDGSNPRMQMYVWTQTSPARDGDFDNGIIVHEYGHGISNRLTGGPGTASCLNNSEQAGEGWSDYFGTWMTIEAGDQGTDRRGVGTYALGQSTNGSGIRDYPYSTNIAIDPRTYDAIKTAAVPHGVGSTWAAMLWEMTWALIDRYGFDADMHNGTGGNNTALQLVVDGLKLQPCSPGFVDARDAILLADLNNNAGANQCLIWDAFAKRGLGYSADQGSSGSRSDGTEAFDIPPVCQETLKITKTATPEPVEAGQILSYSLLVENDTTGTLSNITVTDPVPVNTSYVGGSATCGGSESGNVVTFPLGTMASGNNTSCTFQVSVSPAMATTSFSDDMENGAGLWAATHTQGPVDWALGTTNAHSPSSAWFAQDIGSQSNQFLTLVNPVAISGNAVLSFWHDYDTEFTWDGGVVEISVNGGGWTDLGAAMIQNGYNSTIQSNPQSSIENRPAFSGDSSGYVETRVDLSSYAGNTIQIRFWLGTDGSVNGVGWYVDDVEILNNALLYNEACVTSSEGDNACDSAYTSVTSAPVTPEPNVAVSPGSLSATLNKSTNTSTAKTMTITNLGGASLSWSVMTDSAATCVSPDNPSWALASPTSGTASPSTSDNVTVTFDSAALVPGGYTAAACVISNDPDQPLIIVPLSLTVDEGISTAGRLASGEIAGTGTVSGSYTDTHTDDGVSQLLTEQHQGGPRPRRYDQLIHTWVFDLTHGVDVTFTGNLSKNGPSGDNESFRLYWSRSSNIGFTQFETINSVAGSNLVSGPLNLPTTGAGPSYIRIEDSEQIEGHNQNERIAVDYLALTEDTSGTPPPPPPPPEPPPEPITMIVSDLADVSGTSSRRNRYTAIAQATVVDRDTPTNAIEGALVSGTFSGGVSGGGSCTTNFSGQCTITKNNVKQSVSPVIFTIENVIHDADAYDPSGDTSVQLAAP